MTSRHHIGLTLSRVLTAGVIMSIERDERELPAGWTALAPGARIGVRHLADENQIRDEGRRMEHCVGSYAGRVMGGDCDLFHLEGPGRGATLEIVEAWVDGWPSYRPGQLRGHRNTQPPDALAARANQLAGDMAGAVPDLPKEQREAIRKRRFLQTLRARNRKSTEGRDPTPAERQALWDRVYSTRVPAAWRRLAPERELALPLWSSRYIGQHFDTCLALDPVCRANLTSLIMTSREVSASSRLDQMARSRHRRRRRGA